MIQNKCKTDECFRLSGFGPDSQYCKVHAKQFCTVAVTRLPDATYLYCIPIFFEDSSINLGLNTVCGITADHAEIFYSNSKINCWRCKQIYQNLKLFSDSNFEIKDSIHNETEELKNVSE